MQRHIRQSELKKFKQCRRSWLLAYQRKLSLRTEEEKSTAKLGTLVHSGLEHYYAGRGTPVSVVHDWWAGLPEEQKANKAIANRYSFAVPMLGGYMTQVVEQGWDIGWEVVSVERQVEYPFGTILGDEIILTGKPDLEILHHGVPKLVDHKSVQSFDQTGRELQVDDQMLTYTLMRYENEGVLMQGAIHNEVRRVKQTARSNPPYYNRKEVSFNVHQLRNHKAHMTQLLSEMVTMYHFLEDGGDIHAAYPNPGKHCGWACPFVGVCAMVDDGSDYQGMLDMYYEVKADVVHSDEDEEEDV